MTLPRLPRTKIRSPQALRRELQRRQKSGARVVFTNGCFDLLHKGHVTYLYQARSKGDLLVVALNSDASVRKIKGPSRPVNGLADRLSVLAALECVDFVTWFSQPTPLQVIRLLRPDVLVKGGDWKIDQIVGAPEVLQRGGKVLSLRYVEGKSTTGILARAARSAR